LSRAVYIAGVVILLCSPALLRAQEDEVPLGDLARAARKSKPSEQPNVEPQKVIDNDNFSVMMSKAESERLNGKPVFSIDSSGKTFTMTSPDGTCSLSFDAKATALISTPYVASDLPQDELLKLEGPATIHDDVLEVSLHNGTGWELKEIVVGITELRSQPGAELHSAKLIPASDQAPAEKLPDSTLLYHLKATGAPDSITVFRANILGDFSDVKDWHWALVSARGIPPAAPNPAAQQPATSVLAPQTPSPQPTSAQPVLLQPSAEAAAPADKH
jgi:hypothetical protein